VVPAATLVVLEAAVSLQPEETGKVVVHRLVEMVASEVEVEAAVVAVPLAVQVALAARLFVFTFED
jgi:hypothetical protein